MYFKALALNFCICNLRQSQLNFFLNQTWLILESSRAKFNTYLSKWEVQNEYRVVVIVKKNVMRKRESNLWQTFYDASLNLRSYPALALGCDGSGNYQAVKLDYGA